MNRHRKAARIDKNQQEIVRTLRQIPGVTVAVNHDDILVGFRGATRWYELKSENATSRISGRVLDSRTQDSQKKLLREWTGHYKLVTCLQDILDDLGIQTEEKQWTSRSN